MCIYVRERVSEGVCVCTVYLCVCVCVSEWECIHKCVHYANSIYTVVCTYVCGCVCVCVCVCVEDSLGGYPTCMGRTSPMSLMATK